MRLDVCTIRRPSIGKLTRLPDDVVSFDAESYYTGHAFLLCDSRKRYVWPTCAKDWLDFLGDARYRWTTNTFYNIKADLAFLCKHLDPTLLERLACRESVKVLGHTLRVSGFSFRVDKNLFYDCARFFKGGLGANAETFLKESKGELPTMVFTPKDRGRADILRYCQQDAVLCEKLTRILMADLHKLRIWPVSLESPGAVSRAVIVPHLPDPTVIPSGALTYAAGSYFGGMIDCFQRGHFPMAYQYDINKAYGAQLAALPDVTVGSWRYKKGYPPGVDIGFVCARAHVAPDVLISPLLFRDRKGNVHAPTGSWGDADKPAYFTLDEFRFLQGVKGIRLDVVDGWYWDPDSRGYLYPFRHTIQRFLKGLHGGQLAHPHIVKDLINSIYGKLSETHGGRAGTIANPVYASLVTSRVKLQVARFLMRDPDAAIDVTTDGFTLSKPLPPADLGDKPGQVRLEAQGEMVSVGVNCWSMRTDAGVIGRASYARGIDWFALFEKNPDMLIHQQASRGITSIGEAVARDAFADLGVFMVSYQKHDLNQRAKRLFPRVAGAADLLARSYVGKPFSVDDILSGAAYWSQVNVDSIVKGMAEGENLEAVAV